MKKRLIIWDVIAWIVLGLILLWLILKALGVINTPLVIEYAPYFGAIYLAGWAMHKLETAVLEVEKLNRFKDETIGQINEIKLNCVRNHKNK